MDFLINGSPEGRTVTKTLLIMKLTAVILLSACVTVSAAGYSQKVTLFEKNAPLMQVFNEIKKQTGFEFLYTDEMLLKSQPVSVHLLESEFKTALEKIFENQPLTFTIIGNTVIVKFKRDDPKRPPDLLVPPIEVRGRVINVQGEPIAGVTVSVKGSSKAVATSTRGEFILRGVEENATLVFSGINIETYEVNVGGRKNIPDIELKSKITTGETLIVTSVNTGYQSLSKERNAGSVAKPDMSIIVSRSSSTNILQRLDGLVPGLVVNTAPGGEPLLVRGLTSLNANRAPLIIVDGVELPGNNNTTASLNNVLNNTNPISTINPQDIADITILRDASATSIWGAKAANGVIVITTKRGANGAKLRVEYDGYYNFQGRPDRDYIPKLNSPQFIQVARELFPEYVSNVSWNTVSGTTLGGTVTPHLQIQYDQYRGLISNAQANKSLDSLAGLDNRAEIMDLFYRNAASTNHTVSVSGGGQVHSFYGSLSYTGIQSNTPGEKNNSYKINLRQDLNFSRRLQVSLITDLTNTVTAAKNYRTAGGYNMPGPTPGTSFVPYQLFQDASGHPLVVNHLGLYSDSLRLIYQERARIINLDYVPLDEVNNENSKGSLLNARVVGGVKLSLFKGLRFEGTYGYSLSSMNNRTILDEKNYMVRTELLDFTQAATVNTIPNYWLPVNGGRLIENNTSQKNWTVRNQLVFDQSWNQHQLTILAGQEATSITPMATQVIYRGWDDQLQISRPVNYDTLGKGISGTINGPGVLPNNLSGGEGRVVRTTSYYSTLSYLYQRRYALNASVRSDESNLFGRDKSAQNRPVWSVGGKWMLGREDFMAPVTWIDRLDVRLTYGITGNAPQPGQSSSFDILQGESSPNYYSGSGVVLNTPANNKLTWESTTVYNAGVDFTILHGKLGGSIDGYIKKTRDLIGTLNTSPLTGYAGVTGNFGDLENKGIELSLNSMNLKSGDFMWTTSFNLAYNKNKITKLAVTTPITTGGQMIGTRFLVGYQAFALFAYNYAGLNTSGDPQIKQADGKITSQSTVSKAEDVLFAGTSQPIWTGGLFNTFQYKNFQLGINISYNIGHVSFRDVNTFWNGALYSNAVHAEFANRWKVAGDEDRTVIPRFASSNAIDNARNIGYYIRANTNSFNASFAKIRELSLFYNLPESLIKRIGSQGIRFRLQVSNLMLWKANDLGIDPEFQNVGTRSDGIDLEYQGTGSRTIRTGQGTVTVGAHITL